MRTIEDFLVHNAEQYPHEAAFICGNRKITWSELNHLVDQEVPSYAPSHNRAIVFRSTQDEQFFITYFAIHRAGAVAVPLEKDATEETVDQVKAMVGNVNFDDCIADVLFTTGTTGRPKGVMISHKAILANADNLVNAQGFHHKLTFIICGPYNHIGCLSKVYPSVMCAAQIMLLEGMKDIKAFFQAVENADYRVATFLVPANIRILITFARERLISNAPRIEFIETGAAPISVTDMEGLKKLLPHTRLFNTYASTETGIIATYNFASNPCQEGCLGKAMKHSSFYITDNGSIACQGDTLMSGYIGNSGSTNSLHDNTLITNDRGFVDEKGQLHLSGRADDIINTGGLKVDPTEVENVALGIQGVEDCICVPAKHPVIGAVLKLIVVWKSEMPFSNKFIATELMKHLERYKVPFYYEQADKIARTYNGKIDRKSYTA